MLKCGIQKTTDSTDAIEMFPESLRISSQVKLNVLKFTEHHGFHGILCKCAFLIEECQFHGKYHGCNCELDWSVQNNEPV